MGHHSSEGKGEGTSGRGGVAVSCQRGSLGVEIEGGDGVPSNLLVWGCHAWRKCSEVEKVSFLVVVQRPVQFPHSQQAVVVRCTHFKHTSYSNTPI